MRWFRRFHAYELAGHYWVTIERLAVSDDPLARWVWAVRAIQFRTPNGAVVPAREPLARGYSYSLTEGRARAYRAALGSDQKDPR